MLKSSDEIRKEMERTRERIGVTIDAIRFKADVPSRIQDTVKDVVASAKESIFGRPEHPSPTPPTAPREPSTIQVDI